MKKSILAVIMISMMVLASCGRKETPVIKPIEPESSAAAPTVQESSSTEEKPTEEKPAGELKAIGERVEVDGKMQSYLTGEWKDAEVVKRRPLALMVPNNPPAMPQYGISRASIVYEAPVEGRITRFMCVFEDYDDLDHIGPVRSSRDYYIYEAMALDAIYCNWGLAVPYVKDLINSTRVDNISYPVMGIESPYAGAFERIERPGYALEFTAYMFIDGYKKGVEAKGYAKTYAESGRFVQAYQFADDCKATYDNYPDAIKIYPGGTQSNRGGYGQNNACFTYNPEDGLYYRTQYSGKQIDDMNGEQLAVTNVIFKVCHGEVRDDHDYLAFGCHGTGDAYVFTNGKMIKATWEHPSDYEPNYLYDENGNEIILNQGKTWICNIWKEYSEFAEVDGNKIF